MTYAVVVGKNDEPERPGKLELGPDYLRFSDGGRVRYADLLDVYLERASGSGAARRPSLVLVSRLGERLRISSLEGLGALHELAEHVAREREKAVV